MQHHLWSYSWGNPECKPKRISIVYPFQVVPNWFHQKIGKQRASTAKYCIVTCTVAAYNFIQLAHILNVRDLHQFKYTCSPTQKKKTKKKLTESSSPKTTYKMTKGVFPREIQATVAGHPIPASAYSTLQLVSLRREILNGVMYAPLINVSIEGDCEQFQTIVGVWNQTIVSNITIGSVMYTNVYYLLLRGQGSFPFINV